MGSGELSGGPDEMLGGYLRWTSIPSRGRSNTPSRFMLRKPGKAPAVWAIWVVRRLNLTLPLIIALPQ